MCYFATAMFLHHKKTKSLVWVIIFHMDFLTCSDFSFVQGVSLNYTFGIYSFDNSVTQLVFSLQCMTCVLQYHLSSDNA